MSKGVVLWTKRDLPWSERRAEIGVEGLEFAPAAAISSRPGRFVQLQEDGSSSTASPPQADGGAAQHASQALPGFSCARKVLFFLTYLCYIAVNTVNGPLMPAMKVSLNFTSGEGATIAAVQTVGISAGKLVYGGWPVDVCGARRTYVASMLAVGGLACTYSRMRSYGGIALIAFLVEFLSTPVYPCHVQLIRGWMPVEEAARGFWLLGLSSRTGDVLSKLGYGSLLAVLSWQQLTWCAAGVALAAAILGGLAHRDSPYARDAPGAQISPSELRLVLRLILSSGQFWLGAAAVGSATCIKRSLELLTPLYFSDTSDHLVSVGEATQLAMTWSAGLALSVLLGGGLFNRLAPRGKMLLLGALMGGSMLGCVVMALLSRSTASTGSAIALRATVVFVTALGVGLPYYVPAGMFAVQFGGKNSGVVSAYLDAVSFAVSGGFMASLGPVLDQHPEHGWSVVWAILACIALLMLLLQLLFLRGLLFPRATGTASATRAATT